jgi:hypothetical protein
MAEDPQKRPSPEAAIQDRIAFLTPRVFASEEACEWLRIVCIEVGHAQSFGRHDAYEAGMRDFARRQLDAVKKLCPAGYNKIVAEPISRAPREPVKVKTQ